MRTSRALFVIVAGVALMALMLLRPAPGWAKMEIAVQSDGVFVHRDYADLNVAYQQAAGLGASWLRMNVIGDQDFSKYDRAVDAARANGLKVEMTLVGPSSDPESYGRWVGEWVRHFRGRVSAYGMWNEPNCCGWLPVPESAAECEVSQREIVDSLPANRRIVGYRTMQVRVYDSSGARRGHRHRARTHRHRARMHRHRAGMHRHRAWTHRHRATIHRHSTRHRHRAFTHRHGTRLHRHRAFIHRHGANRGRVPAPYRLEKQQIPIFEGSDASTVRRWEDVRTCSLSRARLYRRVFQAGSQAVRHDDPTAEVLLGHTANTGVELDAFLRKLLCLDAAGTHGSACEPLRADGFSHHPYQMYEPPETARVGGIGALPSLRAFLAQAGRAGALTKPRGGLVPMQVGEFGYLRARRPEVLDEHTRAEWLPRAFQFACDAGVSLMTHYHLYEPMPSWPGSWDTGIVSHDGQPMQSFRALADWIQRRPDCVEPR